jgi:hypothetical protein
VIEIGPEPPCRHITAQIGLRRRNQLNINRLSDYRANAPQPLLLDGREQLALQQQGECVDLIQEQGACRSRFEEAWFGTSGIGEGASLVAKEFCLDQRLRDSGTVHIEEGPLGTWTAVVDDVCHQPLPRAGLAVQQNSGDQGMADGVEGSQVADLRA